MTAKHDPNAAEKRRKARGYRQASELEKTADGKFLLYSSLGTKEIATRKYDASGGDVAVDTGEWKNFITPDIRAAVALEFDNFVDARGRKGKLPAEFVMPVIERAGSGGTFQLTQFQVNRIKRYADPPSEVSRRSISGPTR